MARGPSLALSLPAALLLAHAGCRPSSVTGEPVPVGSGPHLAEDPVHQATQAKEDWLKIVRRSRGLIEQCSTETLNCKVNKVRDELHDGQLLLDQIRENGVELKKMSSHLRGADKALRQAQALMTIEFVVQLLPILNILHLVSSTFALAAHIRLKSCQRGLPPRVFASRLSSSVPTSEFLSLK